MWVNTYGNAVKVTVDEYSDIDEVKQRALPDMTLEFYSAVTVRFEGKMVESDAPVSQYKTTAMNPLLIELPKPEGKLHAVTQVITLHTLNHYPKRLVPSAQCFEHV